jgi:NADH dehydrogenase FAD-containing subunit
MSKIVCRSEKKVILKDGELKFNYLVIDTGLRHSYFGKDQLSEKELD